MSWVSLKGGDATTGNPIGMGSNLTFSGSGELENGWAFSVTVAMLNQDAYSTTAVNLDMGGLGSLNFNQGDSGNGIDALDDKMPTAWEEPWGNALGTGVQLVRGVGPQSNMQYSSPKVLGTNVVLAMTHDMGGADVNDKGASGHSSDSTGSGYDATINVNPSLGTEILSGLNLFVGAHTSQETLHTTNDRYEGVGGVTYDIGPISLGYAVSGISTGKVASSAVDYYKNSMYGIAFNVNDDLSISYGNHESQQAFVNPADTESRHMDMNSWQIAYTMGGASFRYAMSEVTNASYQTADAYDKEANVLSVSLAF
jgi:outer membrane protein OmpU